MLERVYRLLAGYGVFVIVVGLVSVLMMGPKAKTAVMATLPVGLVVIGLALAARKGRGWALPGAKGALAFFTLVFLVRAFTGWMSVINGRPEKLIPAAVISVLGGVTVVVLARLWQESSAVRQAEPAD